jgi:hypothetical protein
MLTLWEFVIGVVIALTASGMWSYLLEPWLDRHPPTSVFVNPE